MIAKIRRVTLSLVFFISGLAGPACATLIYREIFGTTVTDPAAIQENVSAAGWLARRGNDGSIPVIYLNANNGKPMDLGSINANTPPSHEVLDRGFVNYRITTGNANGWLLTTSEYTILRSDVDQGLSFTWYQQGETADLHTHLILQMDGGWYASTNTFVGDQTGGVSTFSNRATQVGTTLDGTGWTDFTFPTSSTPAAIGGAATLPTTGDITAFGIYMPQTTEFRLMFDTFQITQVIPEPSTSMLFVAGLLFLFRVLRKRQVSGLA